jgi:hypothetical protein
MFALCSDNRLLPPPPPPLLLLIVFHGLWLLMAEQFESTFKLPVL